MSVVPLLSAVCRACEDAEMGAYEWSLHTDGSEVGLTLRVNGAREAWGVSFGSRYRVGDDARTRLMVARAIWRAIDGFERELSTTPPGNTTPQPPIEGMTAGVARRASR